MKPQETTVNYPPYWITSIEDVKAYLEKNAVKGKVSVAGYSAGGREILVYEYGEKEMTKQKKQPEVVEPISVATCQWLGECDCQDCAFHHDEQLCLQARIKERLARGR